MLALDAVIRTLLDLRQADRARVTLLAVCPNSAAVLEAAIRSAARNRAPLLLAATLNQVDRDGGYTGWTPAAFVAQARRCAARIGWDGPVYPCLDHGGPWLKDRHLQQGLDLEQSMAQVKASLIDCLEAGYRLMHIDPTKDAALPAGQAPPMESVVQRSVELIAHVESARCQRGLPPVAYEVGTEEVQGGLADTERCGRFLGLLRQRLERAGLSHAWPCFIVAQVGTDLHTTCFDAATARRLHALLAPLGLLPKGHYTDWVANPRDYPASGMGGANVGPEFAAVEFQALQELEAKQREPGRERPDGRLSGFSQSLEQAVIASRRWRKWLLPGERGQDFAQLPCERRRWLLATGSRYVWAQPEVEAARQRLYAGVAPLVADPHGYVVERIARCVDGYMQAFGLIGTRALCEGGAPRAGTA